jgi:hypothetical protein
VSSAASSSRILTCNKFLADSPREEAKKVFVSDFSFFSTWHLRKPRRTRRGAPPRRRRSWPPPQTTPRTPPRTPPYGRPHGQRRAGQGAHVRRGGGLLNAKAKLKARTSAEARAALAATTDYDDSSKGNGAGMTSQEEKVTKRTKRVASRSCSKPKKKKSKKERRRRRRRESPSLSSSNDGRSRRRGRSPSSSSCFFSSSSGVASGRNSMTKTRWSRSGPCSRRPCREPRATWPRADSLSRLWGRFFLFGRQTRERRISGCGRRSDRYADYKRSISWLGHSGKDRVLRRNFGGCVRPALDGHQEGSPDLAHGRQR